MLETFHDGVGFEFRLEREVEALPAEAVAETGMDTLMHGWGWIMKSVPNISEKEKKTHG